MTLAWMVLFQRTGRDLRSHTYTTYLYGVRQLTKGLKDMGASLLRPDRDLGPRYARWLVEHGYAPNTVAHRIAIARSLFAAMVWCDVLPSNPILGMRMRVQRDLQEKGYSTAEALRLLMVCDPFERALVLLGAEAGLRISEVLALRWEHVLFGDRPFLNIIEGKGGRSRRVWASASLVAALQRMRSTAPAGEARVCWKWRSDSALRAQLRRLTQRAGIRWLGFRGLRHLCAALVLERSGSEVAVADHLGHQYTETSRLYYGRFPRLRTAVADGLLLPAQEVQAAPAVRQLSLFDLEPAA